MKRLQKNQTNRLFLRFLISYFILIMIPTLSLGIFIYRNYFEYMKKNLEKNCYVSLEQVCNINNNLAHQMENISQQMYLSQTFRKFTLTESPEKALRLTQELTIMKQTNNYIEEIAFHFTDDPYIYSCSGSNTVEMYFHEMSGNEEIYPESRIREILSSKKQGFIPLHHIEGIRQVMDTLIFIYPIPAQSTRPYAVVLFYVPYESYSEIFGIPENTSENIYIAHDNTVLVQTSNLEVSSDMLAEMIADGQTVKYLEDNGRQYLAVHTDDAYSQLDYYMLVDLNEVYAPLYKIRSIFILLNIVTLTVCGILMYIFSRINYNPLRRVFETLKPLSSGSSSSSDELVRLLDGTEYVYNQNKMLNLEIAQSKDAKRSIVLINFIKGRYLTKDSIESVFESLDIRVDRTFYSIWLVQFEASSLISPIDEETEAIFNRSEEQFDIYATELLTSNTLAVVIFFDTDDTLNRNISYVNKQLDSYGFQGTIGISNTFTDFSNASRAFMEASTCLTQHTFVQNLQIIYFRDNNFNQLTATSYPHSLLGKYDKAVKAHNMDQIQILHRDILTFVREAAPPHFFVQCILKDIAESLLRESAETNTDNVNLYELYNSIYTVNSLYSFEKNMEKLSDVCMEIFSEKKEDITSDTNLLQIVQYINKACTSPNFSLYNVAEHFQMSPSQLSNSFKAQLHVSPSTYITNYKIRMAKHLLSTTNKGVSEICLELGYNDTSSFIRKFRQHVGMTPAAYRKENT